MGRHFRPRQTSCEWMDGEEGGGGGGGGGGGRGGCFHMWVMVYFNLGVCENP